MPTEPKKILRGLNVSGPTDINGRLDVLEEAFFRAKTNLDDIFVGGESELRGDVLINNIANPDVTLTLNGIFVNSQFFPLNKFEGNPIAVAVNAGVVIPGVAPSFNRYYINRGPNTKAVNSGTVFDAADGWGEWFSGSGGGGDVCQVAVNIQTVTTNWRNGTTNLGSGIGWNQPNTGFEWVIRLTNARITQLCNNVLSGGGIPINFSAAGSLLLTGLSINAVDRLSSSTGTPSGNQITITYDTTRMDITVPPIVNPNLTQDNSFTIIGEITLSGAPVKDGLVDPSTILRYLAPTGTLSIFTNPVRFDETYNSATIGRTFNAPPTSTTSTTFPNATIAAGATNITFPALNRTATVANRTLTEVTSYTNATDGTDTRSITRTAILTPAITFPVYLGSVISVAGITAAEVETFVTAPVRPSSVDNQLPNQFSWDDPSDDSKDIKVLLIRTGFSNGRTLFVKATQSSPSGAEVTRSSILAVGKISTDRENYDVYAVIRGQPGAASVYVEYN